MARIPNNWTRFDAPISAAASKAAMRVFLKDNSIDLPNESAVYVIRTKRPFSIGYSRAPSPVLYIGEGNFWSRLQQHAKNWLSSIAETVPNINLDICYQVVKVRNNPNAYRDVEADLLWKFGELFGSVPMLNRQFEYHNRQHAYADHFFDVLRLGQGRGYHWSLRPLASNAAYPAYIKGQFN